MDASQIKTWPFVEARNLAARLERMGRGGGAVLFETGFGPSGLPHIGTFGEVVRTQMVRRAFAHLRPGCPTRLICFSDDLDGLRKVPGNLPNQAMLAEHLGRPLSRIPDPFGTHESFAAHNNARLEKFLDAFGFDCEFLSASTCYESGGFDEVLLRVLRHHDAIAGVVGPTLGAARRRSYSPFLPICPRTGRVVIAEVAGRDARAGTIDWRDPESGALVRGHPVTGGGCKLQWKVDWAARWAALGVDYEMAGKDLRDSLGLSGKICRILGAAAPAGFAYELFLDGKGEKISKSRGNGLSLEEWLRYGPVEGLARFMYRAPRTARRLHFDEIPRSTDDYLSDLADWRGASEAERLHNPLWYIGGARRGEACPVRYSMLLNLAGAAHADSAQTLWGFIRAQTPEVSPQTHPLLDRLTACALHYYEDFIAPARRFRKAGEAERGWLCDLARRLRALEAGAGAAEAQSAAYAAGKAAGFEKDLRGWFRFLYEVLLGYSQGPRFGAFAALYGIERTARLLEAAGRGEDPARA